MRRRRIHRGAPSSVDPESIRMHFIVLGAGAIGCYVGGRLAAHGQPVCLVGRPHAMEPIALHGLKVTDLDGFDRTVPVSALQLADACAPGTPVISLQNGVDNVARVTARALGLSVLAGMVPYNVVLRGAQVHRATAGHLQLQRDAVTERIAPVFNAAGLATVLPADIRAVQWGKLLLNLNNPVNALSDLPLRQELLDRDCRRVFAALQTEALRVMARAGIAPAQVTAVSPTLLPHVLRLPNWLFTRLAKRMLQIDAKARSSMWDDLEDGRVTEIDALSGAVVRLAAQQGMEAPLNARMCELLGGPRQRLTGAQMRRALGL